MSAAPTTPPTTPPAIAPVFDEPELEVPFSGVPLDPEPEPEPEDTPDPRQATC